LSGFRINRVDELKPRTPFHICINVLKSLPASLFEKEENNSPFVKGARGIFKKISSNPGCRYT